jgi:hypothetical protein
MRKTKRFDVGGLSDEVGKLRVFDPTTNMERQLQIDFEQRRKEDQEARAIRDKGGRGLGIEDFTTGDKTPARINTYEYKEDAAAPAAPLPQAKRIITKEQIAAKGFTNLTDYLNDERKLKRRDGKPVERVGNLAKPATRGFDTSTATVVENPAPGSSSSKTSKEEIADIVAKTQLKNPSGGLDLVNALRRNQEVGGATMKEFARQSRVDRLRRNVGTNQETYGMKKGGKVKSASARADGCAIRGKTRA